MVDYKRDKPVSSDNRYNRLNKNYAAALRLQATLLGMLVRCRSVAPFGEVLKCSRRHPTSANFSDVEFMLLLLLTALHDAGFFKRSREGWYAASHRLAELAPARTPRLVHEQNKTHECAAATGRSTCLRSSTSHGKITTCPTSCYRAGGLSTRFTISLFNDSEAAAFLEAEFGEPWLSGYRAALSFSGMAATDLWRFLILYARGGVYADIDVEPIVGLHHFVRPTDDFITVGSLYPRVVNPLFLVARRGEPMSRRAALNHLIAVNRTLRAKVGLPWEGVGREKSVPNEYSANSCFTLGKEVPAEVLANTKNLNVPRGPLWWRWWRPRARFPSAT